jgi:cytochrome c oxidase cbb3-type subunit I/II
MTVQIEQFSYDDAIVRKFTLMTFIWGVVGMLVGVIVALQLAAPVFNFELPWLSFGRLRPLHTNAVIFAFAGNAIFAGIYYSMQRLLKTTMFSKALSAIHFWGWQAIIVAAAVTLPLGITQGKEYAELQWPIDIAIAVIWVVFAINAFGTIAIRRERHIYVAIWFYIATIVTIALLHIFNNLVVPAGLWRSYPIYAGVQDAFMQWWYGHNAVGFLLTTPFLGLMYYFLPKAANRPVFSYRLSIIHFWSLVFLYIWAGPHHLHYTALPAWASTLGMLFSLMLWMPSWGGMLNGLLTLRGAWDKVASDPVLKFFVVAITFYGMSTFEGPLLSVKMVNLLSHYTDWTIAHVHAGALGWVGFLTFGMIYWLLPRLFQTELWSRKLAEAHFWLGTIGILLYIVAIYAAGLTQGLMWLAFDDEGYLKYGDFVETTLRLIPMYWVRVIGGLAYLAGALMLGVNFFMTWKSRPSAYEVRVHEAPALSKDYTDRPEPPTSLEKSGAHVVNLAYKLDRFFSTTWHRRWDRLPLKFTIAVVITVVVASLFEIIPTFLIKSNVPTIATVTPYTPLELAGRDIYLDEGCYNCHSQMIRPIRAETERYGEYSKPGEFVWDHPFQWGSRRIGPDLQRVGGKYPDLWHVRHMDDPRAITAGSIMPAYPWMLSTPIDFDSIEPVMSAHRTVGVPYSEDEVAAGETTARAQAQAIADEIVIQGGPEGLADKQIVAIIAYLQRLGTDITKPEPLAVEEEIGLIEAAPEAEAEVATAASVEEAS